MEQDAFLATTLNALDGLTPAEQIDSLAILLADVGKKAGWSADELAAEVKRIAAELASQ